MPKKIPITPEQIEWLRKHQHLTFADQARYINVCVDTLKRLLVKHQIREFEGAKFAIRPKPQTWERPCLNCRCSKPRPKWQFICDKCKQTEL